MLITKYNIFIFILMFYSIIPQNDICNYDNDCSCKICGENTHNYKTCNYINLFCENGDNVLTTRYSTFKIYYIDYFVKGIDYENFCGELKQPIKDEEIETIIIKTGQSYTKGTRVHCHYSVYYNNYKEYNPIMTYQISQNGNNKLKFNLIVVYHIPNLVYTELFTDDDIRKSAFEDNVADFDLVELFLDFKENDFSHIDEIFSVKVKLNLKKGENTNSTNSENKISLGKLGGLIIGIIAGLILIGSLFYCCCKKEKTYVVKETTYSCAIF